MTELLGCMANAVAANTPVAPTYSQLSALRSEAGAAGDSDMVIIVDSALDGDSEALDECVSVLQAAMDADV